MKYKAHIAAATVVCAGLLSGAAQASVITSPTGTYTAFQLMDGGAGYQGGGPQTVAPGITWTSTNASTNGGAYYGYNQGYDFGSPFGDNGTTYSTVVGLNDSTDIDSATDSMTFTFASPVQAVGAVLNWVPSSTPVTIEALNSTGGVIESLTLSSSLCSAAGYNCVAPGGFYGFEETSADIKSFVLTDGYVAAIGGISSGVPEVSTWVMMLAGFAGLGFVGYRRKNAGQVSLAA
ncbi:hypothetical protein [Rhodoblastus sp.]|uniref:hypothetical protein n=1 Tax=Rhodoblastus sp. TaxID=1962975 RepID=UPI003F9B9057